jgi:hypothetical protein
VVNTDTMPDLRASPLHALCVYAEPLAARRRVIVVADASAGLDAQLVELGARTVHVYDPDTVRARAYAPNAARGASIRELPHGELDVRDGAYDLALVPDLSIVADRPALLARLRKLVGAEGAALIGARASGIDYYELYDLVSLQFANVRMIGQVPFAGVAIAELGETDEEPGVSVDTQLITEPEAPTTFIALAGQRDIRLDAYTIVQLPRVPAATEEAIDQAIDEAREEDAAERAEADAEALRIATANQAELAAAVLRANLLSTQLEEQRSLARGLTAEGERAKRLDEVEAQLKERIAKLKEAETRAGDHYVRAERLTHDIRKLEEELERQRDRATRLTKELEEEKRLRTRAEVDLGMIRKSPELPQARERIGLLEEGLRAAEDAAAVLQARAMEAERALVDTQQQLALMVSELVANRGAADAQRESAQAIEQLAARAERAELRVAAMESQLIEAGEAQALELAELEVLLRQRAQAINALEHELLRRESIVRELIATIEEARSEAALAESSGSAFEASGHAFDAALEDRATELASEAMREVRDHLTTALHENADLRTKLDALALEVARREGELHTRAWRITELEEQLRARSTPPPQPPSTQPSATAPPPADLHALRSELDALRQALTQEHEARIRAESGEELTRARDELSRQAALVEQLGRELDERDHARPTGQVHEETQG